MDVLQTLGKYEIRGTLGKGAMGTVYDGWDPAIARRVAIKTVSLPTDPDPDTAEEIARFRREAQAAGRLTHPNIVAVYDYGETADMAYIVMEFVDGPSLKAPLDARERFAVADIQRVMGDLLAGLQFSHERGVVHRDIKPANIMLTTAGQAKIADFGIARIEMSSMTQAGTMLGTPSYMSPEQFRGEVVDARTDVYSAGVVLYQLLTGERPFEGGLTAIMHKVLTTEPPVPSQLSGTSPPGLDAVVKRAMAKRPDDRFASASAFSEAIRAALAAPVAAPVRAPAVDDSEATMVGATLVRPAPAPLRPVAPVPSPAAPAAVPARATAAPRAAGGSRLPIYIGGGVVAVLALGVGGWFAFGPSQHAPGPAAYVQVSPGQVSPGQQTMGQQTTGLQAGGQPAGGQPGGGQPGGGQPAAPATGSAPSTPSPSESAGQSPPAQPPTPSPAGPGAAPVANPAPTAAPQTQLQTQPTQTAQPQPPPATALPAPTQEATTDLHALRQQIVQALAKAPCTLASGLVQDSGAVSIFGYAGSANVQSLQQQLAGVSRGAALDWRVQEVDPVFCTALEVLRPISAQAGGPVSGLSVTLAGGQTTLHDGDRIMPRVTMADFAGVVRVDYLAHDGTLVHLYPTPADPSHNIQARLATKLAPGAPLSIGEGGPTQPEWDVGPPYGTDMIIVVASSVALQVRTPPNAGDDAAPYLRELAAGIARVRQAGGQIAGTLLLVDTLAK
jgi:hypothetical protein